MSFDLSRFIDKLEPISFDDSGSSLLGGKHFYSGTVNETIKEEDDEEAIQPSELAYEHLSKIKA
jgi:hypothetical protein